MSAPRPDHAPVRSFQRIFRPDRRIYQVEGHRIPVPGGIPLAWLAYAAGALLAVLLLSSRSVVVSVPLALAAAAAGRATGGHAAALAAGAAVLGAWQVLGSALMMLDWPLRLLVIPGLAATLGTQATPDGRPAHRYARSWLGLQLRPERRSLGRPLPGAGQPRRLAGRVWVAADEHAAALRRARVSGPALVRFVEPMRVADGRLHGARRRFARPAVRGARRRRAVTAERVLLARGERLEVRP